MRTVNVVVALLLTVALACSKDQPAVAPMPEFMQQSDGVSIGNGNYLRMEADLAEAVSLTANIVVDASKDKKQLLKLTAAKEIKAVLGGEHELFSYKLTPTHIIAHVKIHEGTEACSLIAIPKVPGKSKVLCLNRHFLKCDSSSNKKQGYDVRGSEVYFTHFQPVTPNTYNDYCSTSSALGEIWANFNEVRRWDGIAEKVETLFHTDPQPTKGAQLMALDVFASSSNGNICIDVTNNGRDTLLCRRESTGLWEKLKGVRNQSDSDPFLKLENTLLSSASEDSYSVGIKLDLESLETTTRKGSLPTQIHFALENGGFIGNAEFASHGIVCVGPDGDSKKVWESDLDSIRPIRLGHFAWYYGREALRRIALDDCTLDTENYFDRTKLLRLASISWAVDDLLRVDGTAPTGLPGSAFLTGKGDLFSTVKSTIPLEHPIDLKWN